MPLHGGPRPFEDSVPKLTFEEEAVATRFPAPGDLR
jgi:hypothetical protein